MKKHIRQKSSEEIYGKDYDVILNAASNNEISAVFFMSKIYKAPTQLELDWDKIVYPEIKDKLSKLRENPSKDNVVSAINLLQTIRGVQIPVASAFLHFQFPQKVPIMDRYSYAVFLKEKKGKEIKAIRRELRSWKKFKINDYHEYYDFYFEKYGKLNPKKINFELMDKGKKILNDE